MASVARPTPARRSILKPDWIDRLLAAAALAMLTMLATALWKGRGGWGEVSAFIWVHLATVAIALALTPVLLTRRRGDRLHRRLGWTWCISMFVTAIASFGIHDHNGGISWIHSFSILTLVSVPLIILTARQHKHGSHRGAVRGLMFGGLLIAGVTTLVPGRLLSEWLIG